MKGIDFSKIKRRKEATNKKLPAAGGITSLTEIKWLENLKIDSQLGMAVYTGKIDLAKAFVSVLDFSKNGGLVPTIVQDETDQVLMLAFSSEESLLKTFKENTATYYSRSKNFGRRETSGNFQKSKGKV